MRDHKITVYEGDYEYFCFKRAELEAAEAVGTKNGASDAGVLKHKAPTAYGSDGARAEKHYEAPISTSRNVKTKEQRRAEAEERNRKNRALRDTKKRLKEVEAALQPAHQRYDELMALMADEDLYNDTEKFDACMAEYNALAKKIPALEQEWLELSEKMEANAHE